MPTNCLDIYKSAAPGEPKLDGIYEIYADSTTMLRVYCEMFKGGWTRIMNRVDNSLSFNKSLNDYIVGFGPLKQNHWLGLRYHFYLFQQNFFSKNFEYIVNMPKVGNN